jgi:hypothetical protein
VVIKFKELFFVSFYFLIEKLVIKPEGTELPNRPVTSPTLNIIVEGQAKFCWLCVSELFLD